MPAPRRSESDGRNARLAIACVVVFLVMTAAAFAAVPLYRAFCQATGFNGAVRTGSTRAVKMSHQTVVVRFDTNVHGLSWRFEPDQPEQTARLGELKLAFFRATNTGPSAVTGRALYNVQPEWAGAYFSKLECFCFKNQTIAPGETVEFPVVYLVDPAYARDPDRRDVGEITLSYTFLPAVGPGSGAAAAPSGLGGPPRGRL